MRNILVWLIRQYQKISFGTSRRCKYYPTCSPYAVTAITLHGVFKGSYLAINRIIRCNPWSDGGLDYVPGDERNEGSK